MLFGRPLHVSRAFIIIPDRPYIELQDENARHQDAQCSGRDVRSYSDSFVVFVVVGQSVGNMIIVRCTFSFFLSSSPLSIPRVIFRIRNTTNLRLSLCMEWSVLYIAQC